MAGKPQEIHWSRSIGQLLRKAGKFWMLLQKVIPEAQKQLLQKPVFLGGRKEVTLMLKICISEAECSPKLKLSKLLFFRWQSQSLVTEGHQLVMGILQMSHGPWAQLLTSSHLPGWHLIRFDARKPHKTMERIGNGKYQMMKSREPAISVGIVKRLCILYGSVWDISSFITDDVVHQQYVI